MTGLRRAIAAALVLLAGLGVAGCEWRGANSLPLPGTEGGGPGAYTIQAQLPDVNNIERNSRVRVGDVTVGNVTTEDAKVVPISANEFLNGAVRMAYSVVKSMFGTPFRVGRVPASVARMACHAK